jgi:hypothetical protein
MTNLTHLSDAELDSVTGGFLNFTTVVTKVAKNVFVANQDQPNIAIASGHQSLGGDMVAEANQVAIA